MKAGLYTREVRRYLENRTDEGRNRLLLVFIPFIDNIAESYISENKGIITDVEDFKQTLYVSTMEFIERYNYSVTNGVPTFRQRLEKHLNADINRYVKSLNRNLEVAVWFDTDTNDFDFIEAYEDEVAFKELVKALEYLTPREKQIIMWRYFDCFTLEKIANHYNISNARVKMIIDKAVFKLKKYTKVLV